MNDDGRTIVYINGIVSLNDTGLRTGILHVPVGDIAFGMANVTVVYEAAGGMCSHSTERMERGQ